MHTKQITNWRQTHATMLPTLSTSSPMLWFLITLHLSLGFDLIALPMGLRWMADRQRGFEAN